MAENDDYLDSMDNNHLEGTNGSLNMTDNSLGVSILTVFIPALYSYQIVTVMLQLSNKFNNNNFVANPIPLSINA